LLHSPKIDHCIGANPSQAIARYGEKLTRDIPMTDEWLKIMTPRMILLRLYKAYILSEERTGVSFMNIENIENLISSPHN